MNAWAVSALVLLLVLLFTQPSRSTGRGDKRYRVGALSHWAGSAPTATSVVVPLTVGAPEAAPGPLTEASL